MKFLKILLFFCLISCNSEIEITNEYILNENWNYSEKTNNSIEIQKMIVIDSSLNIFSSDFEEEPNHWNIVNKLELDSSFHCSYYGLSISDKEANEIDNMMRKDKELKQKLLDEGINLDTIPKIKGSKKTLLSIKVHFNKYNGWNWNLNGEEKQTIGKLENDTWYKFSKLYSSAIYKYVYVDSIGQTHIFTANLNNF